MTTTSPTFTQLRSPKTPAGRHTLTTLRLVDTSGLSDDDDTWIESCLQCGTLDNCGDNLCVDCDDMAA